uniref:Uncharacterized protein n=1 Tax=Geospiza parvula TaxID=87175 RepID=A0A8U8AVN4_GEOPR
MACEFNLNFLKELEREAVLEVLYRDQMVRKTEEERIRKMKQQLQQLRWKGAKNARHEYQERSCARCQKSLGLLVNRGAVCNGCSHRVCSECRVCLNPCLWKCTICYAHGDVKVKAGEWFFEERAKKYPAGCAIALCWVFSVPLKIQSSRRNYRGCRWNARWRMCFASKGAVSVCFHRQ